jgi:hypothetical protein
MGKTKTILTAGIVAAVIAVVVEITRETKGNAKAGEIEKRVARLKVPGVPQRGANLSRLVGRSLQQGSKLGALVYSTGAGAGWALVRTPEGNAAMAALKKAARAEVATARGKSAAGRVKKKAATKAAEAPATSTGADDGADDGAGVEADTDGPPADVEVERDLEPVDG